MKRLLAILLILTLALCLCACGKTAITSEEFVKRMTDLGLEVVPNPGSVDGQYIVKDYIGGNDSMYIEFAETSSEEYAKNAYLNLQSEAPTDGGSSSTVTTPHSGFFSKKTGTISYMVAYVDSTVLVGYTSAENHDDLVKVFETMGYK